MLWVVSLGVGVAGAIAWQATGFASWLTSVGSGDLAVSACAIAVVLSILSLWVGLAIQVKRWHDLGRSGWMYLINFIPGVGSLVSLVWLGFYKGTAGPNKYGDEPPKGDMFVLADGRNVLFTFCLVSSLFLLWGFCNGMIDVMDKHFQEELNLSLSQSAWVQFAHWMGYFLMSLPAGWLATRLGYKGGIIAGLLMVAVGGFWFIPATSIASFWAFLLGVCVVASGLTFLETVANPYTTVLGPSRYAATRINTAQSCNGVGWIFGPIAGSMFFYAKDASGRSTGAETLWIPYAGVAVAVLILAVIFFFAPVPDVKAEDDYHMDDKDSASNATPAPAVRKVNRGLSYALLLGNLAVLIGVFGMILWLVLGGLGLGPRLVGMVSALPHPTGMAITDDTALLTMIVAVGLLAFVVAAVWLIGYATLDGLHAIRVHAGKAHHQKVNILPHATDDLRRL